jgi:hypothetical protein
VEPDEPLAVREEDDDAQWEISALDEPLDADLDDPDEADVAELADDISGEVTDVTDDGADDLVYPGYDQFELDLGLQPVAEAASGADDEPEGDGEDDAEDHLFPVDTAQKALEDWEEWRDALTVRLDRTASVLRDFTTWAKKSGLERLDTSSLVGAAKELEGTARRLKPELADEQFHWSEQGSQN